MRHTSSSFRSCAFAALTALLGGAGAAQNWLPAGLNGPGNGSQTSNWRGTRRHQMVFAPAALPTVGSTLTNITLRGDDAQPATAPVQIDVVIMMSSQGVPQPSNVNQQSFSANFGSDLQVVVPVTRVTFPAGAGATVSLPFTLPFPYVAGNALLVDLVFAPVVNAANLNPTWIVDTHTVATAYWGVTATTTGNACPTGGTWTVTSDNINDRLLHRWASAVTIAPAASLLLLGTSTQAWGAVPLPLDLTALGAPGCALRTSIDAVLPTTFVGVPSTLFADVVLPRDPRLLGADLHAQALLLDANANAAGLRLTQLVSSHLATAPSTVLMTHAYATSSLALPNDVPEIFARNNTVVIAVR